MRDARKARGVGLLLVGLLVGMLLISPAAAHFTQNTRHLGQHAWNQVIKQKVFTKQQANNRFVQKVHVRYAEVSALGTVSTTKSRGITQDNLIHIVGTTGFCFGGFSPPPKAAVASIQQVNPSGQIVASTSAFGACPAGTQVRVTTGDSSGSVTALPFTLMIVI